MRWSLQLLPYQLWPNTTRGFNAFSGELGGKGLALLHELVPSAATIGFLENPSNPASEVTRETCWRRLLSSG